LVLHTCLSLWEIEGKDFTRHAELQKPKRPARNVYAGAAAEETKCEALDEGPAPKFRIGEGPAPKFRNKRPEKNTGSTPVLGRDSEEPQLAFRREYGSRGAFMDLAKFVINDTDALEGGVSDDRTTVSVQEKNLVRSSLGVCVLVVQPQ
jgi:hypothetical protein